MYTKIIPIDSRPGTKSAFTMVEALTSIIILGFCAAALFVSLNLGFTLLNDIRENIIATSILQQEMEGLRNTIFVELPPSGTSTFFNNSLSLLPNSSGTITQDQYGNENILRFVISVSWYTRLKPSKQNTKRIVTLIAKNGINAI